MTSAEVVINCPNVYVYIYIYLFVYRWPVAIEVNVGVFLAWIDLGGKKLPSGRGKKNLR